LITTSAFEQQREAFIFLMCSLALINQIKNKPQPIISAVRVVLSFALFCCNHFTDPLPAASQVKDFFYF
jgi:hypothetical protein